MIVAIHQPNYLPWFGYFAKILQSDIFVFLDDVQYSKNSYTNRVQVLNGDRRHWLTVPVTARLGEPINAIRPAKQNWTRSHCDALANFYRKTPAYQAVMPDMHEIYECAPALDIAAINSTLVEKIAARLGASCDFVRSSEIDTGSARGDARLAKIVSTLAPGGVYLSGSGGQNYQESNTFDEAGVSLRYSCFEHPAYDQGDDVSEQGLSVVDAAFRLGWSATRDLLENSIG